MEIAKNCASSYLRFVFSHKIVEYRNCIIDVLASAQGKLNDKIGRFGFLLNLLISPGNNLLLIQNRVD